MRNDLTDITVVLDRSGSMASVADDTRGGFDTFVADQKKAPGEAVLTLVQFDDTYEFVYNARPIRDIGKLEFVPRGSTALLDAIGRAINETGDRLRKMRESDRPGKVVFVIITDGQENASHEFTKAKVNDMISHQRNQYKWEFVFLGANQDAIQEASAIGISGLNAMTYSHNAGGVKAAFTATSSNLTSMRSGTMDTMNYSAEQRKEAVVEE